MVGPNSSFKIKNIFISIIVVEESNIICTCHDSWDNRMSRYLKNIEK